MKWDEMRLIDWLVDCEREREMKEERSNLKEEELKIRSKEREIDNKIKFERKRWEMNLRSFIRSISSNSNKAALSSWTMMTKIEKILMKDWIEEWID